MGFEDLEKRLRNFFVKATPHRDPSLKERVFSKSINAFLEKKEANRTPLWKKIFMPRTSVVAFATVAIAVLFNLLPGSQSFLSAGEISPKYGPVEILRGDNVFLIEETTKLRKGDVIRIGNKAEADILFPNHLSSTLRSRTQLRVIDRNSLFLEKGALTGEVFNEDSEVSTSRGFVKSTPGATFSIEVSESGETEVTSEGKTISVFDWKEGQTFLSEGEMLKLRTDTSLSQQEVPSDISLSLAQIQAIRAKMIIARTKALTAVENALSHKDDDAKRDVASAQRSFLSIAQVLDASRDLEIGKRKDLEKISGDDVLVALEEKTPNSSLFQEAQAVNALLDLVAKNMNQFSFALESSPSQSFDRFVLLDRIFASDEELSPFSDLLKEKYVVAFLRDVLDEEIRIDQVSKLNQKVLLLPHSPEAEEFLWAAKDLLSPDLADMLVEKIEKVF